MKVILVAVVRGELRLVEERRGALVDRVTGEVLDPARIELRAVTVAEGRRVRSAA